MGESSGYKAMQKVEMLMTLHRLDDLVPILERGFTGEIGGGDEEPDTKAQAEKVMRS